MPKHEYEEKSAENVFADRIIRCHLHDGPARDEVYSDYQNSSTDSHMLLSGRGDGQSVKGTRGISLR